jgi:hypothetical protein
VRNEAVAVGALLARATSSTRIRKRRFAARMVAASELGCNKDTIYIFSCKQAEIEAESNRV